MPNRSHPYAALAILTALNFLNYIDRSVLFQVQPLIQQEFRVSKVDIGLLTTAFMICYMVGAPLLGLAADRYSRRPIMVAGAIVWSLATLLTAVTWDFRSLLIRHAIVGIGEASFVATAPGYIADLFPEEKRGRMLSVFFMAIPAGTALGYMIGGLLGHWYGWRAPFYVVAGPGVVIGLSLLWTREPQRGAYETVSETAERGTLGGLLRNRAYLTATLGLAMITFALGGLQVWMPDFLTSVRGMTLLNAGIFFAVITAINGVGATLTGGWIADRILRRRHDAYYFVSAVTMLLGVPLMLAAIFLSRPAMFPAIFIAEFFLLLNNGPLNAAIVESVGPHIRSTAIALNMVAIHFLGDAASPPIIGYIADRTGSLQLGFLAGVVTVALSSITLFYGMRFAPRVRVAPEPEPRGATA